MILVVEIIIGMTVASVPVLAPGLVHAAQVIAAVAVVARTMMTTEKLGRVPEWKIII